MDQIHDGGAGIIPNQDMPVRPHSFTPDKMEANYLPIRKSIMDILQPDISESTLREGFCNDPRAVVHLTVARENWEKLFKKSFCK